MNPLSPITVLWYTLLFVSLVMAFLGVAWVRGILHLFVPGVAP